MNIYSRKKEFHIFSTKDFALGQLGMASYTKNSLENFLKDSNSDVKDFFETTKNIDDAKEALLRPELSDLSIIKFDKIDNQYEYESGNNIFKYVKDDGTVVDKVSSISSLDNFLTLYDKFITTKDDLLGGEGDSAISREDILNISTKIQTSLSGCLSFTAQYDAITGTQNPKITLKLFTRERPEDGKAIGLRGSPLIVDIPRTISNLTFGQENTNLSDVGVYTRPSEGGISNPANSVAGKLDIRYNKSTGMWQSGTHQVLARLTTDVDSANVGSIDGFTGRNSKDVYDPSSPLYIGQFSVGKALPLSMENGNPYMYGPNYIGCPIDGSKKLEEKLVVNRSNRTFKRGDVVLLSHIDNEWIIQGFDIPTTNKQTGVGRWQFQKFIVNNEDFFRDIRYKEGNGFAYSARITPQVYEQKMKIKYYMQYINGEDLSVQDHFEYLENARADKQETALLNIYFDLTPEQAIARSSNLPQPEEYDIELSTRYYQSTVFDQLHKELGGTNNKTVIAGTNVLKPDSEELYFRDVPNFWGPVFPNGYTSASVLKFKDISVGKNITTNNNNIHKFFVTGIPLSIEQEDNDTDHIVIPHLRSSIKGLFKNIDDPTDSNLLQVPAEMALNGSFKGKFSYPVERINIPTNSQDYLPQFFIDHFTSSERYSYLTYDETSSNSSPSTPPSSPNITKSDLLALSPAQPNIIQFSPLQFGAALSLSYIFQSNNFIYSNLRNTVRDGKVFQLNTGLEEGKIATERHILFPTSFTERNNMFTFNLSSSTNGVIGDSYIRFGPYTNHAKLQSAPLGGPDIIPLEDMGDERSNVIGIIASKNKISIPANISVTFKTKQSLGMTPQATAAGSNPSIITIPGGLVLSYSPGSDIKERLVAQWGDRERTDAITSMGTTALHVRMFDQWPDSQTFYDGRYFSVLHFNPIDDSVDFTEPTFDGEISRIQEGTLIIFSSVLKSQNKWFVNKIRRGMLVSGGGFRYYRRVIGIDESSIKIVKKSDLEVLPPGVEDQTFSGQGYKAGDLINFNGGAQIQINETGPNGSLIEGKWTILNKGEGYVPINFYNETAKRGGIIGQETNGTGFGAKLMAKNGKVYKKIYIDQGPLERVPITKLTLSSGDGKLKADGEERTQITPNGGNGRYDAFYFMHNDILHTVGTETPFDAAFAQYIVLEIGVT
jgi:hypothetical protein